MRECSEGMTTARQQMEDRFWQATQQSNVAYELNRLHVCQQRSAVQDCSRSHDEADLVLVSHKLCCSQAAGHAGQQVDPASHKYEGSCDQNQNQDCFAVGAADEDAL